MGIDNTPLKALLWIQPDVFWSYYNLIKYNEESYRLVVNYFTSYDNSYTKIAGYNFIPKEEIRCDEFDVVIYLSNDKIIINSLYRELVNIGFDSTYIISGDVMRLVGFDFKEYFELKKNTPTIIAPNCWGGNTYHSLRLQFKSPFINLYLIHEDYLKLLSNLEHYLSCELVLKEMQYEDNLKRFFPVVLCDDILLFFNHYSSFDEAKECWIRRLKRIDFNNLFIMFFEESPDYIEKFLELPYSKKICFIPFYSKKKELVSIPYRKNTKLKKLPFWQIVNDTSNGGFIYYNVFDLLLHCRFTPLLNFKN